LFLKKGTASGGSGITTKEKLEEKLSSLISLIVASKDELAHVSLFNWMIGVGVERRRLVSVADESPFLEPFLIRQIRNSDQQQQQQSSSSSSSSMPSSASSSSALASNNNNNNNNINNETKPLVQQTNKRIYLDLLWRHYDFRKDYVNAAKVLTALAEKYSETQISLKERVEYLTQAIVALNSSSNKLLREATNTTTNTTTTTTTTNVKDEIGELNDKKDVALLQEKIYDELTRLLLLQSSNGHNSSTELVQEALAQLDSQLYDITKVLCLLFFFLLFCTHFFFVCKKVAEILINFPRVQYLKTLFYKIIKIYNRKRFFLNKILGQQWRF
jgi:hypothetical protein